MYTHILVKFVSIWDYETCTLELFENRFYFHIVKYLLGNYVSNYHTYVYLCYCFVNFVVFLIYFTHLYLNIDFMFGFFGSTGQISGFNCSISNSSFVCLSVRVKNTNVFNGLYMFLSYECVICLFLFTNQVFL